MDLCQGRNRTSEQRATQLKVVLGFSPPAPNPSKKQYLTVLSVLIIWVKWSPFCFLFYLMCQWDASKTQLTNQGLLQHVLTGTALSAQHLSCLHMLLGAFKKEWKYLLLYIAQKVPWKHLYLLGKTQCTGNCCLLKRFNPTLRLTKRSLCRWMCREKIQRKYDVFPTICGLHTLQNKSS